MKKSFVMFIAIGLFTFLIDYVLYVILLHLSISINIAKTISSIVAIVVGYFLNSKYNFGKNNTISINGLICYIIVYLILVAFHVAMNNCLYRLFENIHFAFIVAMGISMMVNYFVIQTYFSVRRKNVVRNSKK